ncbi:MAG: hypothetical protein J6A40_03370, partial [Bacteroides sp.]|nr:hypothetical protein [Bacteroides sp.]
RSSNELRSCTTCLFMKIFQRTTPAFCESGCKDKDFLKYNPNVFGNIFQNYPSDTLTAHFPCESGCKSTHFIINSQTKQTLFYAEKHIFP